MQDLEFSGMNKSIVLSKVMSVNNTILHIIYIFSTKPNLTFQDIS